MMRPKNYYSQLVKFTTICGCLVLLLSSNLVGCMEQNLRIESDIMGSGQIKGTPSPILSPRWRNSLLPDYDHNPLTWNLYPEERSRPFFEPSTQLVYVGSESQRLTCFFAVSGQILWSATTHGRVVSQPILHRERIFVGTTSGVFYAFDHKTGQQLWHYKSDGEILSRAAIFASQEPEQIGIVMFTTGNNKLIALDAKTGKWLWQQQNSPPDQLSIRGQAPPTVHDNAVYTGYSDGTVAAYQASNGNVIWKRSIKENDRFPDVDVEPLVYENALYVASYSGAIHALNISDGQTRWKYDLKSTSDAKIRNGELFATSNDGSVVVINVENGKSRWRKKFNHQGTFSSPEVDDYYLYIGSSDGKLYVLRQDDGEVIQELRYGGGFSTPMVYNQLLFVLSYNSFLYTFNIHIRRF